MFIFRKIYDFFSDVIITFVFAGAIFVVTYTIFARPFQVHGQSMYPTYHDGEYVLTNLITLRLNEPERGDVIVFHSPQNKEKDFIKRIIGIPRDNVMVKDGFVYVNKNRLPENSYLPSDYRTNAGSFLKEGVEYTIPADTFFVMGDNREFSSDSREWGFVTKEELVGKALVVYWPPNRFRIVEHIKY